MRELRTFDTGLTAFGMSELTPLAFTGPAPIAENKSVVVPNCGAAGDISEPLEPTSIYGYYVGATIPTGNVLPTEQNI